MTELTLPGLGQDTRHGPLPLILLILTVVTGVVDAVSYLTLGHVFVANMTGNVVFLGFAAGGAAGFSVITSLLAMGSFLVGAVVGGRLAIRLDGHRGRLLATAIGGEIALLCVALAVSLLSPDPGSALAVHALVALLGLAMGLQNATARRVAVPDLSTTVLTLTLAGLAADSVLAGGTGANTGRRLAATASMCLGAAAGAALTLHFSVHWALSLILALLLLAGQAATRVARSDAPWTRTA